MNLELRPNLDTKPEPRLKLSVEQKQQLEALITIKEQLRHPGFPDAVKGLEGMVVADKILRDKKTFGILIGSLAIDSLRRTSQEKLRGHKDVDVMVLYPEVDFDQFERGVDWWLPVKYGKRANDLIWINGNDVELNFAVNYWTWQYQYPSGVPYRINPGLYFPGPRWAIDATKLAILRQYEIENPDKTVSTETNDALDKKLEKTFSKKVLDADPSYDAMCKPVKSKFDGTRVLSSYTSSLWYPGVMPEPVALRKSVNKTE